MYLIEFIIKKILQQKEKKQILPSFYEENLQEEESCEHVFMPIDSTSEILACTKCGFVAKQKDLKNKNFFTD